jgi:L-threonylcarbamoyladenylate synthase
MIVIRCAGRDALAADETAAVAAAARGGGVILLPTDTLYGLGADPLSAAGVAAVFRLKGRGAGKPLPVLLADPALVERFASGFPDPWRALAARFWPGPLTLLFPALPGLPAGVRSGDGKVALRVPGSALCRSVLAAAGGALTGTSANAAGAGGTGDPDAALAGLAGPVDVLVNAGTLPPSAVSTLLEMDESGSVREVRQGAVAGAAWRDALDRSPGG